ncbi:YnfA family protein [Methylocystis heyeri]|uniref:YnfA family protein n=1 Tax=Methylocystis heyeri TaxID=391905 RepID=A0A6B8KL54_9HYPH|nr:YnfA family protein [Methylocystis heyeri]QGM47685.1 YnfA family protein [Methylocystis heyeri]
MSFFYFLVAGCCEIAGCWCFWVWLRLGRSALWMEPGLVSLAIFAMALARVDSALAGRAFAAYGGVYIALSLFWLWAVEGARPDAYDLAGACLCLLGAGLIALAPR